MRTMATGAGGCTGGPHTLTDAVNTGGIFLGDNIMTTPAGGGREFFGMGQVLDARMTICAVKLCMNGFLKVDFHNMKGLGLAHDHACQGGIIVTDHAITVGEGYAMGYRDEAEPG